MDPMDIELVNAVLATKSTQSRGGCCAAGDCRHRETRCSTSRARRGAAVPVYQLFGGKLRDRIFPSTGRIAAPTACAIPTSAARRRCAPTTISCARARRCARRASPPARPTSRWRSTASCAPIGGLRRRQGLPRAQLGRLHRPQRRQDGRGVPGRRRARCWHHARHQLPFPHRRLQAHRRRRGPTGLTWLELDIHDPRSIAMIREHAPLPHRLGRDVLERRDFRPISRPMPSTPPSST